jgi:hypothetical protein
MGRKPKVKKPGTVQKIIKTPDPKEPEKAEIVVHGADDLYKELRIENTLEAEQGEKRKLKEGAQVEVVVEADEKETLPKDTSPQNEK